MSTDNYHEVDHRGSRTGQSTIGVVYACVSYVLWGGLPLFFIVYTGIHQMDLLVWRIIFSLVVCLVVVAFTCGFPALRQAMANRRDHLILGIAGILISINWGTYIIAATTGRVLEASLGYFINPLATIVLGIVVLRERLRPVQNIAVGITAVAVVVLTVDYGSLPWVSLVLAGSFALYGLLKNKVGPRVGGGHRIDGGNHLVVGSGTCLGDTGRFRKGIRWRRYRRIFHPGTLEGLAAARRRGDHGGTIVVLCRRGITIAAINFGHVPIFRAHRTIRVGILCLRGAHERRTLVGFCSGVGCRDHVDLGRSAHQYAPASQSGSFC